MAYDSSEETKKHIEKVSELLNLTIDMLAQRQKSHDQSKLTDPEKEIFDIYTPKLKETTYGSDEYKSYLAEMKVALDHHYANNSHHPERFENGIEDMTLIDLLEMLCDWAASVSRIKNGNLMESIEINQKRFGYDNDLKQILINTAQSLGLES